jgi:hypothetical protein
VENTIAFEPLLAEKPAAAEDMIETTATKNYQQYQKSRSIHAADQGTKKSEKKKEKSALAQKINSSDIVRSRMRTDDLSCICQKTQQPQQYTFSDDSLTAAARHVQPQQLPPRTAWRANGS